MALLAPPSLTLSVSGSGHEPQVPAMLPAARPEDYDAEEPEKAEQEAVRGRQEVGDLEGVPALVALLQGEALPVVRDAANALYNLSLLPKNAEALLTALPTLSQGLRHTNAAVRAAMAGVLMNVCATASSCREALFTAGLLPQLLAALAAAHRAAPAPAEASGEDASAAATRSASADAVGELEVRRNALGALNNLLLDANAAAALRAAGGIEILTTILHEVGGAAGAGEARLEDAASSILSALQEDSGAGEAFVACSGLSVLVENLGSPNEELQVRLCYIVSVVCEQVVSARHTLQEKQAVPTIVPLLSSSAEEVQEAAARALEKLGRMPAAAIASRRSEATQPLVELMASRDESVQLAAICALRSFSHSDPKAAAAIRDCDGLKPLVAFLAKEDNRSIQIAACNTLLGCSRNEANKTALRELGAITLLLKMLPPSNPRDAQAAAVATLGFLTLNEDEARILLRLQGGTPKLQALLLGSDPVVQAHAAKVLAHCAPNKESRIAMRLADCLRPLIELLSSPHAATRVAAVDALMQGTLITRTNQVKCRELGAIAPLLKRLEPPAEGEADRNVLRMSTWTLSNLCCELSAARQLRQSPSGFLPLIELLGRSGDPELQRPAANCLFNVTTSDLGAPVAIENTGGLPALSNILLYAEGLAFDEDDTRMQELLSCVGGILLNCAAKKGLPALMMAQQPEMLDRLLTCVRPNDYVPQVSNAAGALMNLCAGSDAAVAELLASRPKTDRLFEVLPAMREEANVMCHLAGTIANLCIGSGGRDVFVAAAGGAGVRLLVETLESSEDDAQSCACCVALLNACHQHLPSREAILDCGGVQALVTALASENTEVKTAAAGALLNCAATAGCAEAIREAAVDSRGGSVSGFELLARCFHAAHPPLLRARAAGALFNCAAFGPDTRVGLLEAGVVKAVAGALVAAFATEETTPTPPSRAANHAKHPSAAAVAAAEETTLRIQANLIGCALNLALNPTCKAELLRNGAMPPLVVALRSSNEAVQAQASTAIAYLSDKAEPRPGSPISTLDSAEDSAALTKAKLRFHTAGSAVAAVSYLQQLNQPPAAGDTDPGSAGGAVNVSVDGEAAGANPASPTAVDELDDAPGARTKALLGLMPRAKVSATHDSQSKQPRFVQEPPETYSRRNPDVVEPENIEDPYEEVPSPLPSPRGKDEA